MKVGLPGWFGWWSWYFTSICLFGGRNQRVDEVGVGLRRLLLLGVTLPLVLFSSSLLLPLMLACFSSGVHWRGVGHDHLIFVLPQPRTLPLLFHTITWVPYGVWYIHQADFPSLLLLFTLWKYRKSMVNECTVNGARSTQHMAEYALLWRIKFA